MPWKMLAQADALPVMQSAVTFFTSLGGFGVLSVFSWLMYHGKIVTRRELDAAQTRADKLVEEADDRTEEMKKERDEYKSLAFRSQAMIERTVATTSRATELVEQSIKSSGSGT